MGVFNYASRLFRYNQLLTASRIITHDEILTLGSKQVTVVPAPGPNRARILVSMSIVAYKPEATYEAGGDGNDQLTGNHLTYCDTVSIVNLLTSAPASLGEKQQLMAYLQPASRDNATLLHMAQCENVPITLYAYNDYTGGAPENKLIVHTVYYDSSIV